jgi:hypothetical protein
MSEVNVPTFLTQLPEESNRRRYNKAELLDYFSRIELSQKYFDPVLSDESLARTKDHGLPFCTTQPAKRLHLNFPSCTLGLSTSVVEVAVWKTTAFSQQYYVRSVTKSATAAAVYREP